MFKEETKRKKVPLSVVRLKNVLSPNLGYSHQSVRVQLIKTKVRTLGQAVPRVVEDSRDEGGNKKEKSAT